MSKPFSYDVYGYPSTAAPVMHPDRFHVQARLHGLPAAHPERCRYLEIGCADGVNLLAAAVALPEAQFVGLDLAEAAVRRGNALAAELGLTNVRLHHADLTRWEPDGPFDYVAAHGVYSWVPPPVRDALMALVKRSLAPDGVAYISYNTLPGCHLRRVLWDMMRFHTAGTDDPEAKIDGARELLQLVHDAQEGKDDPPNRWVRAEAESVLNRPDKHLTYHDDLSEFNHPVYFMDFVGHAGGHGLRYLADAHLPHGSDHWFPPAAKEPLAALGRQNPLLREQYYDFLRVRRFRTSLVCHADRATRAEPALADDMLVGTLYRPVGEPDDGQFAGETGEVTVVADPFIRRLVTRLAARWPGRLTLDELAVGEDPVAVRHAALLGARIGLFTLHGLPFPGATAAGERPAISKLALRQAADGGPVSTLLHSTFNLTDDAGRALFPLLDGTRTRAELAAAVQAAVPTLGTPEEVADRLEINLEKLARMGVLV